MRFHILGFIFVILVGMIFSTSALGSVDRSSKNWAEQDIFTDQLKSYENFLNLVVSQEEKSLDMLVKTDEDKKKEKRKKKKGKKKKKSKKVKDEMKDKNKVPESDQEGGDKKEEPAEGHGKE